MRIVFSAVIVILLLAAFVLASNHFGFAQKLAPGAFGLIVLGVILYLLEIN